MFAVIVKQCPDGNINISGYFRSERLVCWLRTGFISTTRNTRSARDPTGGNDVFSAVACWTRARGIYILFIVKSNS